MLESILAYRLCLKVRIVWRVAHLAELQEQYYPSGTRGFKTAVMSWSALVFQGTSGGRLKCVVIYVDYVYCKGQ
jgi:hypothetical protein